MTVTALLALGLALSGCDLLKTKQPANVGLIIPLSGSAASYGESMRNGTTLALEELKRENSDLAARVRVVVEDSRSTPSDGVTAYAKLTGTDGVGVIMPAQSSVVTTLLPMTVKDGVMLLNCPATTPSLRRAGDLVFSTQPLSDEEAKAAATLARSRLKSATAAIVYLNDASGQGFRDNFVDQFQKEGGKVVASDGHAPGATDFRILVARLAAANPDLIYLPTYASEAALFIRQFRKAGGVATILSYSAVEDPKFIELGGTAVDGVIYSQPTRELAGQPAYDAFSSAYRTRFGQDPDIWALQYYDCVRLISQAVDRGASDPVAIAKLFRSGATFKGAAGEIVFGQDGVVRRTTSFKIIRNGQRSVYD